jgi:hypothetical protein
MEKVVRGADMNDDIVAAAVIVPDGAFARNSPRRTAN